MFLLCVSLITFRVLSFSNSYIQLSPRNSAFHLIVGRFVGSMALLILSPNLISLIVGWDGLGISSFFLVIFYKRNKAFNAGLLTALSNRVGDGLILISFTLGAYYSSFSFVPLTSTASFPPFLWLVVIIAAAFTKRAQVPFRAWLPAAMAAPTPVSALVHSSTLVTAGVYLLLRLSPLFYSQLATVVLGVLGAITMIIARVAALIEADLKKIVALSTLSQLGVIVLRLSLGIAALAFFHLVAHAFFKALLFIATGNLIHNSADYQDLRRIGGHLPSVPVTKATVILTKIRLCGLPFFSAFFSKELILERLATQTRAALYVYAAIWARVLLTIIYSLRFIFYILFRSRAQPLIWKSDYDFRIFLRVSLLFLPRVAAGQTLLFNMADYFGVPLLSFTRKGAVLRLILVWAPAWFMGAKFIAFKTKAKSVTYLWALSRWRGAFPTKMMEGAPYALSWLGGFSWKDRLLLSWALSRASALSKLTLTLPRGIFQVLTTAFSVALIWAWL